MQADTTTEFDLELSVFVRKVEVGPYGYRRSTTMDNFQLSNFQLSDRHSLGELHFGQVASVLERFHALAEALKAELG